MQYYKVYMESKEVTPSVVIMKSNSLEEILENFTGIIKVEEVDKVLGGNATVVYPK